MLSFEMLDVLKLSPINSDTPSSSIDKDVRFDYLIILG